MQGTKIFQYCTCPAGRVTYNFHLSCKHLHLSFKSVCNKEHKGVICNMTSLSNCSQSIRPTGRVLWEELLVLIDFTRNYEPTSGIFVSWHVSKQIVLTRSDQSAQEQSDIAIASLVTVWNIVMFWRININLQSSWNFIFYHILSTNSSFFLSDVSWNRTIGIRLATSICILNTCRLALGHSDRRKNVLRTVTSLCHCRL